MKRQLLFLWALIPLLCLSQNWTNQNSGITNDLNSISFIDDNNGWAVGRQGKIVRTTNGGATWTEENSGTTKDLNKIHMLSSSVGYAVGDDGTFIKYNGSTWSTIGIGFSQDMHGVYFIDANTGWISGDWGRIMMTTNGGSSWSNQVTNAMYSNLFYDLHMLSSSEGWAVGTSGRVLKYNGTNWSNVSNPASGDIYSVHFTSSSNGFMTGKNSTVYKYDGSNWSQHNTSLPDNSFHVYDVYVVNSNLAYAATTPGLGGAGIILKYNGSTWTKDYEFTGMGSELFHGITVTPSGQPYAVAAGGTIKTVSGGGTTPTGIAQNKESIVCNAYPNPFSEKLYFQTFTEADSRLFLRDLNGKIVDELNIEPNGSVMELDLHQLESGIYFYELSAGDQTVRGKLIKN